MQAVGAAARRRAHSCQDAEPAAGKGRRSQQSPASSTHCVTRTVADTDVPSRGRKPAAEPTRCPGTHKATAVEEGSLAAGAEGEKRGDGLQGGHPAKGVRGGDKPDRKRSKGGRRARDTGDESSPGGRTLPFPPGGGGSAGEDHRLPVEALRVFVSSNYSNTCFPSSNHVFSVRSGEDQ